MISAPASVNASEPKTWPKRSRAHSATTVQSGIEQASGIQEREPDKRQCHC